MNRQVRTRLAQQPLPRCTASRRLSLTRRATVPSAIQRTPSSSARPEGTQRARADRFGHEPARGRGRQRPAQRDAWRDALGQAVDHDTCSGASEASGEGSSIEKRVDVIFDADDVERVEARAPARARRRSGIVMPERIVQRRLHVDRAERTAAVRAR